MLTESVNFTGFTLNRIAEFNPFSVLSAKKEQEDGLFMGRSKVVSIQKQCPATWEEALQQFLWWKQAQGLSKRTVEDYKLHVTMFYKRYPAAYREKDCLKQAAFEYMGQPIKPATYNMRLIYLRSFCNWCLKEAIMVYNPFNELKKRRDEGRVVNIDCNTLKRLLSTPEANTFAGQRDYAPLPPPPARFGCKERSILGRGILAGGDIASTTSTNASTSIMFDIIGFEDMVEAVDAFYVSSCT
jgi:hypothetical protein